MDSRPKLNDLVTHGLGDRAGQASLVKGKGILGGAEALSFHLFNHRAEGEL